MKYSMPLFFSSLLLLMLSATPSFAELDISSETDASTNVSFPWVDEELYYSIRVNGAEAMRAGIRTGTIRHHQGHPYIPINGMARSRGFFNAIYPLDDHANTYLNPKNFHPLRSEKTFNEAGQYRSYFVDYRHHTFEAQVRRERKNRTTRFNSPIPASTHDMLTWLYDLRRSVDVSIGDEFSFYIYDGWLLSRLDLKIVAREDILTPIRWFKTWKISFSREIMDINQASSDEDVHQAPEVSVREHARHSGYLWFSRDENLLPVRVTISTMLGSGEAVLIRYQPGRRL